MDAASLILLAAGPLFLAGIGVEVVLSRRLGRRLYDPRDAALNIATALVNQLVLLPWYAVEVAVLVWVGGLVPWRLEGWTAWLVAFVAVDLAYYAYHRAHHEIRLLWAAHVVHHSSEQYNLSVALRQPWFVFSGLPFLVPVGLLGIAPEVLLATFALNLLYQFFIHTQLVDRLWAPVELVMNTPSHHRVHHGSQDPYLDTNYGGVLIVWDRLLGTFQAEGEPVRYGLTKNIGTTNLLTVETHEFRAIWRDVRAASSWRDRAGYVLRGPGWTPSGAPAGAPAPEVAAA